MDDTEIYLNVKEITEPYIIKKVYHISGFDCANCATEVEEHLNSKEEVEFAKIDFSANKMYISYKNKAWTVEELINKIAEVESDPLEIYEEGTKKDNKSKNEKEIIKKVYHISGFDCANCATEVEEHLNTKEEVENAKIDFSANKMYISYKNKPWTVEEIIKIIAEVESDPLEIYEEEIKKDTKNDSGEDGIKKVYHISGFDCANCATEVEEHLNTKEEVEKVKIDFSANKMYISYKKKPWTVEEIKNIIAEVESDPLEIYEEVLVKETKKKKEPKIFTKAMWITSGRVAFGLIMTAVLVFILGKESLNWVRFGLYLGTFVFLSYDIFWKVILHIRSKMNRLDHNMLIMVAGLGAFGLFIFHNIKFEKYKEDIIYDLGEHYTIALDEGMDATLVVILYQIGHIIESVATNKSKAEVMKAVELRVETANLLKDGKVVVVNPEELEIGQKIVVKVGELIPVDGIVLEGEALIDTSSLTGEFVPERSKIGGNVFSGCLIKQGQIIVEVKKIYADSTISKILELITSGGEKKSKADEFVDKFSKFYTPIVVIVAIIMIIAFGCATKEWAESICKGLEVLVAGCPCSIVISVPLAYFAAIGLSSKNGIIVKGASYLDKLREMKKLITDKTGTITKGTFSIQVIKVFNGSKEDLLNNLYIIESLSNHPIGKAIVEGQDLGDIAANVQNFEEKAGFGVSGTYNGKFIIAGSKAYLESAGIEVIKAEEVGTAVYLGVNKQYMGYVVLSDQIKENAKEMVDLLHEKDIEVILLTGDREENAKELATKLNIDKYHSNLLPEQKAEILEQEMKTEENKKIKKYVVGFVGDGINDAPSIKRSDIGIAMGGIGSDIAVENADIVIMNDDPIKIYDAIRISKMARNYSVFNIVFSIIVKVAIVVLINAQDHISGFRFPMYAAVLADTGLTVLMVLNSLTILYRKIRH